MKVNLKIIILFLSLTAAHSASYKIKGQLSAWNFTNLTRVDSTKIGIRYLPEITLSQNLANKKLIDAQASFNLYGAYDFFDKIAYDKMKPYRVWIRFSTSQFEARLGLQKIEFGPAMLLRSLMWFDRLDPRDPLQFTEGVQGALLRYYFLNNANIWIWGLYGNNKSKGLEAVPTEKNSFEYGTRIQYPILTGELALTYHHRRADISELFSTFPLVNFDPFPEDRFAFDGKWDAIIGIWFESALTIKDVEYYPYKYQKYLTVGADYTLGLGNGVHLLGEHFVTDVSEKINKADERIEFSALLADYSFSLWDQLMLLFYYSWENQKLYNFINWRRTYDNWSFNLSLYWNPVGGFISGIYETEDRVGSGKGFQFMVTFNH